MPKLHTKRTTTFLPICQTPSIMASTAKSSTYNCSLCYHLDRSSMHCLSFESFAGWCLVEVKILVVLDFLEKWASQSLQMTTTKSVIVPDLVPVVRRHVVCGFRTYSWINSKAITEQEICCWYYFSYLLFAKHTFINQHIILGVEAFYQQNS